MVKYVCDRCNKIIEAGERCKCHVSYTSDNGDNSADLCKECFEEFLNWMKNKPVENKLVKECEKNIVEGYEKIIHEYQQRIIELTEKLNKARANRDLWMTQCREFHKDYKVLSKKLDEIITQDVR